VSCPSCAERTRENLEPCPGCGSIGVPFLDGYFNVPPPVSFDPWHTVPWDPEASGEEITGRVLRALRITAQLAADAGWSAATLEQRQRWNEPTLPGALVRTAVRMGLIR
jgi:hypothetical protein